jgi:cell division septum initiation protein DivIVA
MVDPMHRTEFAPYVRQAHFRHALFGYRADDVRRHLDLVSGWFSLAGLDDLLSERSRELTDQAEARLRETEKEATQILADARREADEIRRRARQEAQAVVEQARRRAALESRGRSRVGRPVGVRNGRPRDSSKT